MNNMLNISSSPHARDKWSTAFIMRVVLLALMPATLVGVIHYGLHALLVVLVSVATAVLCEFLFDKLCHKPDTWKDGSAAVTGLLLALCLSPSVPLHLPVLGSMFAILVAKCCFGGLGKNFINPALAGRCFLLISFGRAMSSFQLDGVSSATPIALLMNGKAVDITRMFLGTASGVIGGSVLALMAGGLALWALDFIHGEICFSVLGGFTLYLGLFGGQGFDPKFLLAHLCGGGVVMGAFFMATDYVTSPVSRLGQFIYGCLIGVLGGIFRLWGNTADSFSYAIIIGNVCTPLIDTYIVQKPLAYRKIGKTRPVKREPFRIPKPVIALTIIAVLAGLALSGVFFMTKDTIADQELAREREAYKAVCPDAASFDDAEEAKDAIAAMAGESTRVNEALVAKDEAGNVIGYALNVTGKGFGGDVTMALGLTADGKISGISFTELNETAGLGMRADEPAFKDQFIDRSGQLTLVKGDASGEQEISAITGASVTSGAVISAVNAGLDLYETTLKGGN